MIKKKVNPRKRPVTLSDVNRAKKQAQEDALNLAMCIFLTVLLDKENATKEIVQRVWSEVNALSSSISEGYVNIYDLRKTLNEEYDILV